MLTEQIDGVVGGSSSGHDDSQNLRKRKRARSPDAAQNSEWSSGLPELGVSDADYEFDDPDRSSRVPKRVRRIAVRSASLPTAAVALRSRRAERLAKRKREKVLRKAAAGVGGMQVDN
jgi:hypothetical protein